MSRTPTSGVRGLEVSEEDAAENGAMTIIKWSWVHGSLGADLFDTLDAAVASAHWGSENGTESLACIEVIDSDGNVTIHDHDAVYDLAAPLRRRADEAYKARPTPTVILDLQAPDGTWTAYDNFVTTDEAEAEASRFGGLIGAERVRLRPYGRPS